MKLEGSLHCLQKPATGPYPQPHESCQFTPTHFFNTHFHIILHLRIDLQWGLFPSGFDAGTLFTFLVSPLRATWSIYRVPFDFVIIIIFGEECKLGSPSLCNYVPLPTASSLLCDAQAFSSKSCFPESSTYFLLMTWETEFYKIQINGEKRSFVYFNLYLFRLAYGSINILNWTIENILNWTIETTLWLSDIPVLTATEFLKMYCGVCA
jgi:hypothetical protein